MLEEGPFEPLQPLDLSQILTHGASLVSELPSSSNEPSSSPIPPVVESIPIPLPVT